MSDPRLEQLRRVPLFAACTDKQLRFITTRVEDMDFPSGKELCVEGQRGADFFIIVTGAAECISRGQVVRTLGPGDFFGEIALLDQGPRTATIRTTAPSRCLVLGPAQFSDLLHQNAEIAVTILHAVVKRLRGAAAAPND
ncbi:N/A [soil metagenome]